MKNKWIKIDYDKPETLPEAGKEVLVFGADPKGKHFIKVDRYICLAGRFRLWSLVTHWQPLPEPPTTEIVS